MLSSRTRQSHPRLHERARATLAHIDTTIKSVRQIINDLRPNVLDLGLRAAVEWQIGEFSRRTGVACELIGEQRDIPLDDSAATALFRILQESLSNIARHSKALTATVQLGVSDGRVVMSISDNGIGLRATEHNKSGSFGLVGIEERMNLLGGTFSLRTQPGQGTTILVTVPVRADRPHNAPQPVPDPREKPTAVA
jgi:signal transduction histidine kinase